MVTLVIVLEQEVLVRSAELTSYHKPEEFRKSQKEESHSVFLPNLPESFCWVILAEQRVCLRKDPGSQNDWPDTAQKLTRLPIFEPLQLHGWSISPGSLTCLSTACLPIVDLWSHVLMLLGQFNSRCLGKSPLSQAWRKVPFYKYGLLEIFSWKNRISWHKFSSVQKCTAAWSF